MKKVLHYSPDLALGGIARTAVDVAVAMQAGKLAENTVLAPGGAAVSVFNAYAIPLRRARRLSFFNRMSEQKRLRRVVATLQPDVLLAYGFQAARLAVQACRRMEEGKRPRIIALLAAPLHSWFAAGTLRGCDAVAAISRHLRNTLDTKELRPVLSKEKLWVIPYGVDGALVYPHYKVSEEWQQSWQKVFPDFRKTLSLCIPGSLTPARGLESMPELLHLLEKQGVKADIYLPGRAEDAAYARQIEKHFRRAGVGERLHMVPAALAKDMREVLCSCDITLAPAPQPVTYDRAVLEALALGRPVAGYEHGAVGEYLNAFLPEGRVPVGKLEALADTLVQWNAYRPDMPDTTPYPYRITDTAFSLSKLSDMLLNAQMPTNPASSRSVPLS